MEKTIEDRLIYNNYKLVADKIRKTLCNIRNIPEMSAKRWVWEMIQNAKDVPNKFGKVSIKIELKPGSVVFSHNASFFSIDNVLGLLQQISSKSKGKNDTEEDHLSGKFGTGFIGTHLLSTKIKIKGVVKYKGLFRKFVINLDRSAETSEELLEEVKNSIEEFRTNMNNENSGYEILSTYEQKESDFDTSFEYSLEDEESIDRAKEGINDLIKTAPITLATQCKKISSILVKNEIDNEEKKYTIKCSRKKKTIYLYTSTIVSNNKEENVYYFSYESENKDCKLFFQVEPKGNSFIVVEKKRINLFYLVIFL